MSPSVCMVIFFVSLSVFISLCHYHYVVWKCHGGFYLPHCSRQKCVCLYNICSSQLLKYSRLTLLSLTLIFIQNVKLSLGYFFDHRRKSIYSLLTNTILKLRNSRKAASWPLYPFGNIAFNFVWIWDKVSMGITVIVLILLFFFLWNSFVIYFPLSHCSDKGLPWYSLFNSILCASVRKRWYDIATSNRSLWNKKKSRHHFISSLSLVQIYQGSCILARYSPEIAKMPISKTQHTAALFGIALPCTEGGLLQTLFGPLRLLFIL